MDLICVSRLSAPCPSFTKPEPAFVRDEAEEKNNEANESPTDRHSDRGIVSSITTAESARFRLVLFCVTNTGLKGWTETRQVHMAGMRSD